MAALLIVPAALALLGSLSIVWLLEERARARRIARQGGGR